MLSYMSIPEHMFHVKHIEFYSLGRNNEDSNFLGQTDISE